LKHKRKNRSARFKNEKRSVENEEWLEEREISKDKKNGIEV
jgi:hypothetical protein